MRTQAEADEDAAELAEWRRQNGVPEPKPGRPPLRRTGRGLSYRQGRPPSTAAAAVPAPSTEAPEPKPGGEPRPARGSGSPPAPLFTGQQARSRAADVGSGAAGVIVGLFAWGFALNFIRGGWSQAAGWFGAKFFNEPYTGAASSPASSPSKSAHPAARSPAPLTGNPAAGLAPAGAK